MLISLKKELWDLIREDNCDLESTDEFGPCGFNYDMAEYTLEHNNVFDTEKDFKLIQSCSEGDAWRCPGPWTWPHYWFEPTDTSPITIEELQELVIF